jgi:hypothetical protein
MFFKNHSTKPIVIEIYSKPNCHLCDEAKLTILQMKTLFELDIRIIDITEYPDVHEKYKSEIPVIYINGRKSFKYRVAPDQLFKRLQKEV